jgi:hypothetical protein
MNTHGINFDIGLPLTKQEEFDILFVPYNEELEISLTDWLTDTNSNSLLIAGQIGTGKSTLINKLFFHGIKPDIFIQFDKIFTKSKGSFYGVLLGKILELSEINQVDLTEFGFHELYKKYVDDIKSFAELLTQETINYKQLTIQQNCYKTIEKSIDIIKKQISTLIDTITKILQRKLFIFAEGVDKFNPNKSVNWYDEIIDILNFISVQKTLYEANIIHLLEREIWVEKAKKIVLPNATDDAVKQMFYKRLGNYTKNYENNINELVYLSGGNFRQALRLLVEFEFAKRKLKKEDTDALNYSRKRVIDDMFSYINIPYELLKVVFRDKYIHSGTFKVEEKFLESFPLYRNLILIKDIQKEGKWAAIVNPLFETEVENYIPKTQTLKQVDTITKYQFTEILDKLASYFLEPDKKEVAIILYDDIEIARIIDDYLVGRAGSYEEIFYESIDVKSTDDFALLFNYIPTETNYTGFSYFFFYQLSFDETKKIDVQRDTLIINNMLWWINKEHIRDYLKNWEHFRQFVKIFDLQKDILSYIEISDIEQDINDLELIEYSITDSDKIKSRLEKVLEYLKSKENAR